MIIIWGHIMKKILTVAAIFILTGMLMACGRKAVDIDIVKLGDRLSSEIAYDDSLGKLGVDKAGMFLNLTDIDIVDGVIYEGAGATAEEIVVLECASGEEAVKAKERLSDRVKEQKESFENYVPAEIPKLDSAVIEATGRYAILCVSGDANRAREIIFNTANGK